jgi:hypothetical protein
MSGADLESFSMSQAGNAISFLGAGGPSGKPGFSLGKCQLPRATNRRV